MIRRGGSRILRVCPRIICDPTSSNSGMLSLKKLKNYTAISQLRAIATHKPILGSVTQGALELFCHRLGGAIS